MRRPYYFINIIPSPCVSINHSINQSANQSLKIVQLILLLLDTIVIVIVNSKFLKRHSKAKRRASAYSRALHQSRGVFQRIVRGRLRSGCQRVRGGRLGVKAGVFRRRVGEKENQLSQRKNVWRGGTSVSSEKPGGDRQRSMMKMMFYDLEWWWWR